MKAGNLITTGWLIAVMLLASCRSDNMEKVETEELVQFYERMDAEAVAVSVNDIPVATKLRFVDEDDEVVEDYSQLRQIALIRHGEPDLKKSGDFTFEEAKKFFKDYDSVGIVLPDEPFFTVEDSDSVTFFTSTLPRAQATAKYLFGSERDIVSSADFREFERALGKRRIQRRLPLKYWKISARIQWLLGINLEGVESFGEARARARKAAATLDSVSVTQEKIVLVAHGLFNRFVRRYLKNHGWQVIRKGDGEYLSTTILARYQEPLADSLKDDRDMLLLQRNF